MKTIKSLALLITGVAVLLSVCGCEGMSRRDQNTALGAGAGAIGGALLTGGNAIGVVGGAAVGGIIGNDIGHDRR